MINRGSGKSISGGRGREGGREGGREEGREGEREGGREGGREGEIDNKGNPRYKCIFIYYCKQGKPKTHE